MTSITLKKRMISLTVVASIVLSIAASTAMAQFGGFGRPADLDPFNRNSGIRREARNLDELRRNEMEGTRYEVTIRNPNAKGIHFKINGKPFLIMGKKRTTISGRGTPEITFDYGLGNGSLKSYKLHSGNTYVFRWSRASLGAPHDGIDSTLDLYND